VGDLVELLHSGNGNGSVDTTTALTDQPSGNNVRGAVTDNGTQFWVVGGTGGVRYKTFGTAASSTAINTAAPNFTNSPTFSDRFVQSRVVVQDGQTVGLAGLITDNINRGNQGIPFLKNVPILGLLAGTPAYEPQPVDPPAEGQVLVCCASPATADVVVDL